MSRVTIVGAGFSGLTLAYHLINLGMEVVIYERKERTGGLIGTMRTDFGISERAANAMIADRELEKLFHALELEFAPRNALRKKRYIYWDQPRRWPVSAGTSWRFALMVLKAAIGSSDAFPYPGETVKHWGERVVNAEFTERILIPALQGVFAGDADELSATLTVSSLLLGGGKRGKYKGSVAPERGMGQLIDRLTGYLQGHGVKIRFEREYQLDAKLGEPTVVCTSAWDAAELTKQYDPHLSARLEKCEPLPIVTATCFFEPSPKDIHGFGCLFPANQKFNATGVVFNADVFEGRSKYRSETWIFGGAGNRTVIDESEEQILAGILVDRLKLTGEVHGALDYRITHWPKAIPHYTVEWERILAELNVHAPLYLHGNYLGVIGLARIHQRSIQLAKKLKELYG